jgi:hypothetical protein
MVATLAHPAGPLQVVAACLEYEPAYNDDRIAQAAAVADLTTDPQLDAPPRSWSWVTSTPPPTAPSSGRCATC